MKLNPPKTILAALCAAVLLFPSCKKTDNNNVSTLEPSNADIATTHKALSALRSTPQTFNVTAGVSSNIKAAEGSVLKFYPNSFKDKNGNVITSGTVKLEIIEMYKLGDMIANRTSTVTSQGVLRSGGEISIKATMGGQEVFANKYGLGFKADSGSSKPMELFYGENNSDDSVTIWGIQKTGPGSMVSGTTYFTDLGLGLIESPYFLFDSCTKFNMVNCDHPYDATSENATINVVFPDNTFKTAYASLAIAYPSINVAVNLWAFGFNTSSHTMTFKGWVPIGPNSQFVLMIPKTAENYYYYQQAGVTTNGMTINASMVLITKSEMKAKLAAL